MRYLASYWRQQLVALVATALVSALNLVLPLFTMLLIDRVITGGQPQLLLSIMGGFVAAILLQAGFTLLRDYTLNWTGQAVLRDMRLQLFDHLQRLPLPLLHQEQTGRLMSRVLNDTAVVHGLLTSTFIAVNAGTELIHWRRLGVDPPPCLGLR